MKVIYRCSPSLIMLKDLVWLLEGWRSIYLFTVHSSVDWSISASAFGLFCSSMKMSHCPTRGAMHFLYRQDALVSMSDEALQCSITLKRRDLHLLLPSSSVPLISLTLLSVMGNGQRFSPPTNEHQYQSLGVEDWWHGLIVPSNWYPTMQHIYFPDWVIGWFLGYCTLAMQPNEYLTSLSDKKPCLG